MRAILPVIPLLLLCVLPLHGCRFRSGAPAGQQTAVSCTEAPVPSDFAPGSEVPQEILQSLGADVFFVTDTIPDPVFARMEGVSWKPGCPVARRDLRYLRVLHRDAAGRALVGEMVCAASVSEDLQEIFRSLFDASWPIESMRLIDDYGGDDDASMRSNNTTCFNYRPKTGQQALSRHAYGTAVDINPLYNPYVRQLADGSMRVEPEEGRRYADRNVPSPYRIERSDLCHSLFRARGFSWGGMWRSCRDYQHFER